MQAIVLTPQTYCLWYFSLQVKTWFQNRRMKQKRKRAEDVERRAKLSFLSSSAYAMYPGYHGYQSAYEHHPPTYTDKPLVLRSELPSKNACPPASPWSSLPPYPPPPYWASYPGSYSPPLWQEAWLTWHMTFKFALNILHYLSKLLYFWVIRENQKQSRYRLSVTWLSLKALKNAL